MLCRLLSGAHTMNRHLFFPLTLATPFHTEKLAVTLPTAVTIAFATSSHESCFLVPYTFLTPMTCLGSFFTTPGTPNWPCTLFLILMCLSFSRHTISLRIHFGLAHCPSILSLSELGVYLTLSSHSLSHFALTFLFSLPPPLPPFPLPAEFAMIHSLLLLSLFILNPIQLPS